MRASAAQRAEGRRAGDPVRTEPRPTLEPSEREVRTRPEISVEPSRGKAVPSKLELERCHVPAAVPVVQHAVAETVAGVAPQGSLRPWARDSVDDEPGTALEGTHGAPRSRAEDPVDGPAVEPARLQSDLTGGDVGGPAGTRVGGEREEPDEREQRNACSESHEQLSFAPERDYPRPL